MLLTPPLCTSRADGQGQKCPSCPQHWQTPHQDAREYRHDSPRHRSARAVAYLARGHSMKVAPLRPRRWAKKKQENIYS